MSPQIEEQQSKTSHCREFIDLSPYKYQIIRRAKQIFLNLVAADVDAHQEQSTTDFTHLAIY
jgi:hypothetical protein